MNNNENISNILLPINNTENDYFKEPVCFKDCEDHYELIYTGAFESIGRQSWEITNLLQDLKKGDKDTELHIFISSMGGDCENLSLVLQQVLQYHYRVTVCCGAALSAGFILWACGHEKYVSPYSELMYHTIYSGYEGKGMELTEYGNHIERLTSQLIDAVNMKELISEQDMQKGKSTQVWYIGEDFIKSGKAKNYSEYEKRKIPSGQMVVLAGDRLFAKCDKNYVELIANCDKEYSYKEILQMNQEKNKNEQDLMEQEEIKHKKRKKRLKIKK